jgi:Amt family ammonium transporter
MDGQLIELAYALDTFYFLVMGAFVMWMAAGFSMLEAGLVRSKSTVEILTKNIALYSIASIMYMLVGYNLMYPADGNGVIPAISFFLGGDNEAADVIASGGDIYYSALSDFFFQVVFVATAMSIVSGAVAERMKLSSFFIILHRYDRINLSYPRILEMGWWFLRRCWFSGLCRIWSSALVWCSCCISRSSSSWS